MTVPLLDVAGYLRVVRASGVDQPLLVAVGGFGGPKDHDRVGVLALDPQQATLVADAWLESASVPVLVDALLAEGHVARQGGWDTMYATAHRHAWTTDGRGPFEVWSPEGLVCSVVREVFCAATTRLPVSAIAAVEPYVGDTWVERGVRVRTHDGALVTVARDEDHAPAIDPTYDGLMLMADVGWTHDLARALAVALGGVAVVDCT